MVPFRTYPLRDLKCNMRYRNWHYPDHELQRSLISGCPDDQVLTVLGGGCIPMIRINQQYQCTSVSTFSHGQDFAECATGQTVRSVSDVRSFPKLVLSIIAVDMMPAEQLIKTEVLISLIPKYT